MLNWDGEVAKARVKARLKVLPAAAQVSFAAGALQHALGVVARDASWRQDANLVETFERVLRSAWEFVGTGTGLEALRERGRALVELLPDEDSPAKPGLADLVDGLSELGKLAGKPSALAALDVASFAYQAVAGVASRVAEAAGGEAEYARAERASERCLAEVCFQLDYLSRLERAQPPFVYHGLVDG